MVGTLCNDDRKTKKYLKHPGIIVSTISAVFVEYNVLSKSTFESNLAKMKNLLYSFDNSFLEMS